MTGTPAGFVDLHAHPDLPWLASVWRRRVQGFRLDSLDPPLMPKQGPQAETLRPAMGYAGGHPGPFRLFGAAFYRSFLLDPFHARQDLFASLARFRRSLRPGEGVIVEYRSDLDIARLAPEAFLLCVESLRYIREPADIRTLWDLGVRSLQPIHFLDTAWGGSSREGLIPEGRGGLTSLGRAMLSEMARPGMLLDLAHMNARTARDCLAEYPGPIFCSHAGFTGVKRNSRNLDPDLAKGLFRRGGIVGVTCWRHLLAAGPDRKAWTQSICRTADALAALDPRGKSLVAIGSDRGAPIHAPAWLFSPLHLEEIAAELGRLGWSPQETEGFLAGNALAFLARSLPGREPTPI